MSHTIRLFRYFLVSTAAIAVLAGCKPPTGPAEESNAGSRDPSGLVIPVQLGNRATPAASKIALCLPNAADPHQRVQINLLADLLRTAGDCELALTDAQGSATRQNEQLRSLAASKPKAVLLLPVDAAQAKDEIAALRQAGALVIGLDASLNDGSCDTVVFCDQKKIGSMAADIVVSALKRKAQDSGATEAAGRVVQIQGEEDHPASRARSEGFFAALKAHPGIVVVHDAPAKGDKANAALRFKEALKLQKDIDAAYAHNDMMALGVSEAAAEGNVRENLLIVGTDGVNGPGAGLEMLRKSQIDATIHQPLLVDVAWRIVEKMAKDAAFKPKAGYEINPVTFTPRNLEELLARGLSVPEL